MTTNFHLFAAAAFASTATPPDDTNTYPQYMAVLNSITTVMIFGKTGTTLTLLQNLSSSNGVNSPQCASMSPNGRWLIIANGVNGDASNFARVYRRTGDVFEYFDFLPGLPGTTTTNVCLNPMWSSDSQYVALCVRGTGTDVLHVFRFVGDTITKCGGTANIGQGAASVTIAPDASWVGCKVQGNDEAVLYSFNGTNILTDVSNTRTLNPVITGVTQGPSAISWTPDSRYLAYMTSGGAPYVFYKRNLNETFTEITESGTPSLSGTSATAEMQWLNNDIVVYRSTSTSSVNIPVAVGAYRRSGDLATATIAAASTTGATGGRGGHMCVDPSAGGVFINPSGGSTLFHFIAINPTTGAASPAVNVAPSGLTIVGQNPNNVVRTAISIGTIPV